MKVNSKFSWNTNAKKKLDNFPDEIIYGFAREVLDTTYPIIPLSNNVNSGRLRASSMSKGVQGSNGDYYIGSYIDYAKYVYQMNPSTTNWTTSGTTSRWFGETIDKKGNAILSNVIGRNELK